MENNKSEFKSMGVLYSYGWRVEIQISRSGDAARYMRTAYSSFGDNEITRGRWQEIRYSKRKNYAYISMCGKRLYLNKFSLLF